jgi:hypothetical protein
MLRLTAIFKVSLSSLLFVNRPPWQEGVRTIPPLRYDTRIDDSDVEIALLEIHHAMTKSDRSIWAVAEVRISVSRSETVDPPPIQRTAQGGRDFSNRWSYFQERDPIYRGAAIKALHRLVCFFKYRQAHALLRDTPLADLMSDLQWTNEMWTDETGQEFPSGSSPLGVLSLYGIELDEEVGVRALAAAADPALQQALAEPPIQPELYEELLSDAKAALFQGHLHRAVLELAISCEVATRYTFSIKAPSGRYQKKGIYLLLDQEAKRVFGQSFEDADSEASVSIKRLFQRRGQVAHQGKGVDVDLAAAKEWFKAADRLFHWLRRMRP